MNACKYSIGQKVQIARWEGPADAPVFVVRSATVVNTESRYHGNNSTIYLSVAHDDCFEDMRVSTRLLTKLIRNAAEATAAA
jgi:hypothetical protein